MGILDKIAGFLAGVKEPEDLIYTKKRKKKKLNVFNIILIVVVVYFLLQIFSYSDIDNIITKDDFFNVEEDHFTNMPVKYKFSEECVGPILKRIEWAFDIIENETEGLVFFEEVMSDEDILFICYSGQNVDASKGEKVIWQGRSTIDDFEGNNIIHSEIEFWSVTENIYPQSCTTFPILELHELLHSFDFDHIDKKYSIMHPYIIDCGSLIEINGEVIKSAGDKIDNEIVLCLKHIYSNGKIGTCSGIDFLSEDYGYCKEGWYPVAGTSYCCPEPNMEVVDGYCV